jgi:hypothetical protein
MVNEFKDGLVLWVQIQEEILVATMEGHENGKTLC